MNRWGIILFTLFGLMLANILLPDDIVFAVGSSTSCVIAPATCVAAGNSCLATTTGMNQIPATIYDNSACNGSGLYVNTLVFTDPAGTSQPQLPANFTHYYFCNPLPIIICGAPQVCDLGTGACCTPSWTPIGVCSAGNGCGVGTIPEVDGCGNSANFACAGTGVVEACGCNLPGSTCGYATGCCAGCLAPYDDSCA